MKNGCTLINDLAIGFNSFRLDSKDSWLYRQFFVSFGESISILLIGEMYLTDSSRSGSDVRPGSEEFYNMVPNTSPMERRKYVRFSANMGTRIQSTMSGSPLFYSARIRNISRGGVKLVIDKPLAPGTVVKVMVLQPVKARVAHCAPEENGTFVLGLTFVQAISLPEMLSFLERQTSPQWLNSASMVMSMQN
jgi:hypothetical protein